MPNKRRILSKEEMISVSGNEIISLTSSLGAMAIGLLITISYRFFGSYKGSAKFPGGFEFVWGK